MLAKKELTGPGSVDCSLECGSLGRSQGLNAALFDVERLEVLRGPLDLLVRAIFGFQTILMVSGSRPMTDFESWPDLFSGSQVRRSPCRLYSAKDTSPSEHHHSLNRLPIFKFSAALLHKTIATFPARPHLLREICCKHSP